MVESGTLCRNVINQRIAEQLYRITVKDATVSGPVAGQFIIVGHVIDCEPEIPVKRDVSCPVTPNEPDTEIEVGYSHDSLEPLTVEYRNRKIELTKTLYILFRYVNDLYRTEGKTAFDFAELSEVLTGDDCSKSKNALELLIRRIVGAKVLFPGEKNCNRTDGVLFTREKSTIMSS